MIRPSVFLSASLGSLSSLVFFSSALPYGKTPSAEKGRRIPFSFSRKNLFFFFFFERGEVVPPFSLNAIVFSPHDLSADSFSKMRPPSFFLFSPRFFLFWERTGQSTPSDDTHFLRSFFKPEHFPFFSNLPTKSFFPLPPTNALPFPLLRSKKKSTFFSRLLGPA